MKRLLFILAALVISSPALAADYLYFADAPVTQGETTGYVLGTGENQVQIPNTNPNLEVLETNFQGTGKDIIRYCTSNPQHLVMAHTMTEFIGTGYIDAVARVMNGISNFTVAQINRLFRAQWLVGETWTSGTAADWVAAGKPVPVRFTRGVVVLGKEAEMD